MLVRGQASGRRAGRRRSCYRRADSWRRSQPQIVRLGKEVIQRPRNGRSIGRLFGPGAARNAAARRPRERPHRRRYDGRTGGVRHGVARRRAHARENRRLRACPARTCRAQYARWARLLRALGAPTARVQRALRARRLRRSASSCGIRDLAQKQPLCVPCEASQRLPRRVGEASPWARAGAGSGLVTGSSPRATTPQILAWSSRWCSAWGEHHQSITSGLEQVVLKISKHHLKHHFSVTAGSSG